MPSTSSQVSGSRSAGTSPVSPTFTGRASAAQQPITIRARYGSPLGPSMTKPVSTTRRSASDRPWSSTRPGRELDQSEPDRVGAGQGVDRPEPVGTIVP